MYVLCIICCQCSVRLPEDPNTTMQVISLSVNKGSVFTARPGHGKWDGQGLALPLPYLLAVFTLTPYWICIYISATIFTSS